LRLQHERGKNPHPDAFFSGRRRNSNAGLSQPPNHRATAVARPPDPAPLPRHTSAPHHTPWRGALRPRLRAAERGTQERARYHERQDRDREHHDFRHPPHPMLSIGPEPPRNRRGRRQTRPRVAGGPASLAEFRCSSVALRHRLSAALLFAALRDLPSARLGARSPVWSNRRTADVSTPSTST
jgi:hypothetical protein